MIEILQCTSDGQRMAEMIENDIKLMHRPDDRVGVMSRYIQALEIMIQEGWVQRSRDHKRPYLRVSSDDQRHIRLSDAGEQAIKEAGKAEMYKSNI